MGSEVRVSTGTRCLLVYPEFRSESFWNYRATCKLLGAKYPEGPLGLITVAALLPDCWEVRLVDCNVEPLKDDDIEWADVVFTGGMIAQQVATLELISQLKCRGKTVVVGGPDPTSSPHVYEKADHLVLGEAEITLPRWLRDYAAGEPAARYEAGEEKADVTKSPTPRFDLLNFDRYMVLSVQFARGCPFNCEFCDIIELFGRVPRLKTASQMFVELERLYELGYRGHVDFVDDNFIGNKRDVKKFLVELRAWQEDHKWPFHYMTQASINLADDEHLLALMQDTCFDQIFIGIESPDEETLRTTQKYQNTRRSISDSLRKIYSYGMVVNTGYILGLDGEPENVAQGILDLIKASAVPANMVGLLFVLPNTQLQRRLSAEDRLRESFECQPEDVGDQCTGGLNFETERPRADVLRDYRRIVDESYRPEAYFSRILELGTLLNCEKKKLNLTARYLLRDIGHFFNIIWQMGVIKSYRGSFWLTLVKLLWRNPRAIRYCLAPMVLYLHFGDFSRHVVARTTESIREATAVPPTPQLV